MAKGRTEAAGIRGERLTRAQATIMTAGPPPSSGAFDPRERETQPDLRPVKAARPSWDAYFLEIAEKVSTRATCDRKHVGAIIVRDRAILATGYNGSVRELPHCDDIGHDLVESDIAAVKKPGDDPLARPKVEIVVNCVRTVHAETNAVAQAARNGVRIDGAKIYVNTYPCWPCFKLLANAGIIEVIYSGDYRNDPRVEAAARATGIKIRKAMT